MTITTPVLTELISELWSLFLIFSVVLGGGYVLLFIAMKVLVWFIELFHSDFQEPAWPADPNHVSKGR